MKRPLTGKLRKPSHKKEGGSLPAVGIEGGKTTHCEPTGGAIYWGGKRVGFHPREVFENRILWGVKWKDREKMALRKKKGGRRPREKEQCTRCLIQIQQPEKKKKREGTRFRQVETYPRKTPPKRPALFRKTDQSRGWKGTFGKARKGCGARPLASP